MPVSFSRQNGKQRSKIPMKYHLFPADICLPDFSVVDGSKWASVACDQYTSQTDYWDAAYEYAKDSPSTLNLMLPEAFLDKESMLVPIINENMRNYLSNVFIEHKNTMIYLERTQADGRVRRGLVGCVDLEEYDYQKGSETLIRATEGTVIERIPPRVAIRRGAVVEMPHIMILIDNPKRTVIDPIAAKTDELAVAYDFDLMAGGGHVKGYFVGEEYFEQINLALERLSTREEMKNKYGLDAAPLLFAMGDGNHSLASAKALYEEIKAEIGEDAARSHPARFALCEIVNLHDTALDFEPIYRVVFGVDTERFICELEKYVSTLSGSASPQEMNIIVGNMTKLIRADHPVSQLTVGTVQNFLDEYVKSHPDAEIDYIHGEDTVFALAQKENTVGILYGGMTKDQLFKTVICDGALPRKTFSMGHAEDKRFYLECRKIR